MNSKVGLSIIENNRIRVLLYPTKPILFELRQGENGFAPYDVIDITDNTEQQKMIELATKYATRSFGVQSLFQTGQGENAINYESCEIDFSPEYVNKNVFLNEISYFVSLNDNLIEKIKSDKCTQIMISFPMDYPKGYLEEKIEKLKYTLSNNGGLR